uniref:Peptidase M14 domain-containing protein n=1 Tax=Paramoeba aestuarina TaxID=180227 RepID=A0A7S4U929_9EUKA
MYLIHDLLYLGDTDERYKNLIDNTVIFIVPTMNPDGYEYGRRGNANNVDLNRNFPDQFKDISGQAPETLAIMDFIEKYPFVLSANFHGGDLVANYPYDGRPDGSLGSGVPSLCPDDDLFREISSIYADNHLTMAQNKNFEGGITNGADWYSLYGGMQDYNYVYENIMEITLEISFTKTPRESTLKGFWEENKEAMIAYMERIHGPQIKGKVVNELGEAIEGAVVSISSIDKDITSSQSGWFYRLLTPGTYTLTITHPSYQPDTATFSLSSSPALFMPTLYKKEILLPSPSPSPSPSPKDENPALLQGLLMIFFVIFVVLVVLFVYKYVTLGQEGGEQSDGVREV